MTSFPTDRPDPGPEGHHDPVWSEDERLAALDSYAILDTPPEPLFDDLVRLAADICDTPVALLTLVDRDRQWFKAEVGLGMRETPLGSSVCAHVLLKSGLTVVPDLLDDERFACNPLVIDEPRLRFYAGFRLVTPEGLPLGTLCVLDTATRPEGLSPWQARALATLAAQAMESLELRRIIAEREAAGRRERKAVRRRQQVVLNSISDGVFALDSELRFTLFNRAAEELLGKASDEVLGRKLRSVFPKALSATVDRFRTVIKTGEATSFTTSLGVRPDRTVHISAAPMNGGLAVSFTDISFYRRAEEQQQVLIAELQHRTRNLLAVVRSIAVQTIDSVTSLNEFLLAFNGRLSALSRVQSLLLHGSGISVPLRELVEGELAAHGAEVDGRRIMAGGPEVHLSSRAVQVMALALHELATNALKHGALGQPQARLSILWDLSDDGRLVTIRWTEEGVTLPPNPNGRKHGFGRQLIENALPYDLGAATRFHIAPDGVRCELDVPLQQ